MREELNAPVLWLWLWHYDTKKRPIATHGHTHLVVGGEGQILSVIGRK